MKSVIKAGQFVLESIVFICIIGFFPFGVYSCIQQKNQEEQRAAELRTYVSKTNGPLYLKVKSIDYTPPIDNITLNGQYSSNSKVLLGLLANSNADASIKIDRKAKLIIVGERESGRELAVNVLGEDSELAAINAIVKSGSAISIPKGNLKIRYVPCGAYSEFDGVTTFIDDHTLAANKLASQVRCQSESEQRSEKD